jgi:hypothetical protein
MDITQFLFSGKPGLTNICRTWCTVQKAMEETNKKRGHKTNSDLSQEHKYDNGIHDSTSGGKYLD